MKLPEKGKKGFFPLENEFRENVEKTHFLYLSFLWKLKIFTGPKLQSEAKKSL
jgi:hypothetical protein